VHATAQWFSLGSPFFSTNKADCHDITEILLKMELSTIKQTNNIMTISFYNSFQGMEVVCVVKKENH
jgi:hypothetical protein